MSLFNRGRAERSTPAAAPAGSGRARATPRPSTAANAAPHVVVDYGLDVAGGAQRRALMGEAGSRLQGHGGGVYVGDTGDAGAGRTFYGRGPQLQRFEGAAALASNPVTYREGAPMIDNGVAEGPYADPARRIFAQRLARRQPS